MKSMGKHEGEILFRKGYLLERSDSIVGGYFQVDIEFLKVTDIPQNEPIPRKNLTDHLLSEDFFDVARFPKVAFNIKDVNYQSKKDLGTPLIRKAVALMILEFQGRYFFLDTAKV